jgi:hypothetical protein
MKSKDFIYKRGGNSLRNKYLTAEGCLSVENAFKALETVDDEFQQRINIMSTRIS